MKNLVICGDSFSIGIGCEDLYTESYGALLAKDLNLNLFNLAKGSSTNFSIYLQVKYAIENYTDIDFLCIGTTCYNRVEWFKEGAKLDEFEIKNTMVNYHQYPPYVGTLDKYEEHPMARDSRYTGEILTENFNGVLDYLDLVKNNIPHDLDYVKKYNSEPIEKLKLLKDYYLNFRDVRIQREYDNGVILMAHALLQHRGIKHLILINDNGLDNLIPTKNIMKLNWQEVAEKYPEKKWNHASYKGHIEVFNMIKDKIQKENLLR